MKKAMEKRMNVTMNSGLDSNKFLGLVIPKNLTEGDSIEMRVVNGVLQPVVNGKVVEVEKISESDYLDRVRISITEGGYLSNATDTYKRWVMAQMFKFGYSEETGKGVFNRKAYNRYVQSMTLNKQWRVMLDRLHVLAKKQRDSRTEFEEELMFFNVNVLLDMMESYLETLLQDEYKDHIYWWDLTKRKTYIRKTRNMIIMPLMNIFNELKIEKRAKSDYGFVERRARAFYKHMVGLYSLDMEKAKSKAFENAYKGYGAYFALENMVLNHNVPLTCYETGITGTGEFAKAMLKDIAESYKENERGWRLLALFNMTCEENRFNFSNRMEYLGVINN